LVRDNGEWLGVVLPLTILDDHSRYIIAWKLCTTMKASDDETMLAIGSRTMVE
jgi:transposase InsO family protein